MRDGRHQVAIVDSDNNDKTWTLTSHQETRGVGLWEDGNEGRLVVTAGGRVGIGTTNPNHELVIQGNDPAVQVRDDTSDNSPNAARLELLERGGGNFDGGAFFWWNGETDKASDRHQSERRQYQRARGRSGDKQCRYRHPEPG